MKSITAMSVAIALASPATTPSKPEMPPTLIGPVQHGYDHGWRDCAPTLDKLIRLTTRSNTAYGMFNHWSPTEPNSSMFTTVMSGAGTVTTYSAVKNGHGSCDVTMTQVVPFNEPCDKVQVTELKDWTLYEMLGDVPIYRHPTAEGNSAILSPLPSGCLVTKLVILFGS